MSVFLSKLQDDYLQLAEEVREWVLSSEKAEIKTYQDIQHALEDVLDKKALVHLVVIMSTYVNGGLLLKAGMSDNDFSSDNIIQDDVEKPLERVRQIQYEPFKKAALMMDRIVRLYKQAKSH